MSEQLTLIEEAFGLTVVEGENLQLTLDGGNGPAGPAGAAGIAGPNTVTTSTSTTLNGYIFGNGTTIAGATAAASAATPSTLVVRTSGGAASFTGITNNGLLTLSTGTTFSYGAGIAAAHRTALGLGTLATQSGTFSGDSSGTNTGDQDLSNLLSRRTTLEVNGTDAPISQSLVEQGYLSNGRRVWASSDGGTLLYDGASWFLTQLDPDSLVVYDAFKTSGSYEPWLLTGWTVTNGSGEPTFVLDPAEPLGNGVIIALDLPADTNGGFLTAGTGGTLPITRGGTGATTAGLARTALGSGATGDELFTAASASAARTTLELGTGNTAQFLRAGLGVAPSATIPLISRSSNVTVHAASFTNTGTGAFVSAFEGNAPNLTVGQAVYFAVGRNPATNNQFSFGFEYAGNGSTSNKFNINAYGSAALFSVLASGNVGIGTATPTAALHVVKNAASAITSVFANPTGDVFNQFVASSGTGEYGVWQDALYFQALASLGNGIRFFIGATNALQIAASTNVGIGTTTPASKLTVTGGDAEVTDVTKGLILKTPDGLNRYRVTIDNAGALTTTLL